MTTLWKRVVLVSVSIPLLTGSIVADEVTDTIKEALEAYKKGEYTQATEDLTYVIELLKQKKGDNLKNFLPEPLEGWTAEKATSLTAGSAMLGGGTMVSRTYHKFKSKITIEMVTDSPMMEGIAMMLSNPGFASSDGGKLTRINREKAMIKYNKEKSSGEITMVVDKRFMITVTGKEVSKEELLDYAKAIDIKKLKEI
ncbi:MAG TPA: hypothetical protein EYP21_11190 [Syntrophaceae bacterium]|nr:hypothetical protein [Syntrophaceae bacterium]